jgi:uncharacterized protein
MATLQVEQRRFSAGDTEFEHPVDALGRIRWRSNIDERAITHNVETGVTGFAGHAAVFGQRTWIGSRDYGFWEQIDPVAFNKTLADGADVRFLINHDPNLLLARSTAGTLKLSIDERGLVADADMAPTSYAADLAVLLERGDVTQMSFAFEPIAWRSEVAEDGKPLITLTEVRLWDVSAVTYPAYEQTDAGLRGVAFDALTRSLGLNDDEVAAVLRSVAVGEAVEITDRPAETTDPEESQPAETTGNPTIRSDEFDPGDRLRDLRFAELAKSKEKS